MKVSHFVGVLAFTFLGFVQSAHADIQPMIVVTADESPGEIYHLGVELNADQTLAGLYFEDDKKKVDHYSLENLKKGTVLLRRSDRDIITLKAKYDLATKAGTVIFTYLNNGAFNTHKKVSAQLQFNVHTAHFELVEVGNTSHVISTANIVSRYVFNKVIGISSIDFD